MAFSGRIFLGGCQAAAPPAPARALPLHQPGISSSSCFSTAWKSPRLLSHRPVTNSPGEKKTPRTGSEVTREPCFETHFLFQTARLHRRGLSIRWVGWPAGPRPPLILSILSSTPAARLGSHPPPQPRPGRVRTAQSQHARLGLQNVGSLHFPGDSSGVLGKLIPVI